MARYLVMAHRSDKTPASSALEAVKGHPGVKVVDAADPHSVTIEATEEAADSLRQKLGKGFYVEAEVRRGLL